MSYVERFTNGKGYLYRILPRTLTDDDLARIRKVAVPGKASLMRDLILNSQGEPLLETELVTCFLKLFPDKQSSGVAIRAIERVDQSLSNVGELYTLRYEGYVPNQRGSNKIPREKRRWQFYAISKKPIVEGTTIGICTSPGKGSQSVRAGVQVLQERDLSVDEVHLLKQVDLKPLHKAVFDILLFNRGSMRSLELIQLLYIKYPVLKSRCKVINRKLKENGLHFKLVIRRNSVHVYPLDMS